MDAAAPLATPSATPATALTGGPGSQTPPTPPARPQPSDNPAGTTPTDPTPGQPSVPNPGPTTPPEKPGEPPKPAEPQKAAAEPELRIPAVLKADDPLLGDFKAFVKEKGLQAEQAQGLLELYARASQAKAQAETAELEKMHAGWVDAAKADPVVGGKDFDANVAAARKATLKFADPQVKQWLVEHRLGDHPMLIRLMTAVGKALAEDSVAMPTNGAGASSPDEQILLRQMYPTMFQE